MNKKIIGSAIFAALAASGVSTSAHAALASDAVLLLSPGSAVCDSYGCPNAGGSWFAMDLNNNSKPQALERVAVDGNNGLILGTTQAAGDIDQAWSFNGSTGNHWTSSAANVLSASGNTATIDMSGWQVAWSTLAAIPMTTGAWDPVFTTNPDGQAPNYGPFTDGVALVSCGVDCGVGDSFTLDYTATVPLGDPSNFGGTQYYLHLEGTIAAPAAVPVPAAVWLFGSGLIGLAGVARRRKAA